MTTLPGDPAGGRPRRALALLLLPAPLLLEALFSLWFGDFKGLLGCGGSYALFVTAALLVRAGSRQEVAGRPPSRARRWPLKLLGSAVAGAATAIAALLGAGHDPAIAFAFGVAAAIGSRLVYGADAPPELAPTAEGVAGEEVAGALAALAEGIGRIEATANRMPLKEFQHRLRNIARHLGQLFRLIEQEPANFPLCRRFLNVYLDQSLKVMEKYARHFPDDSDLELEHNFRSLLVDIENTCDQQHRALLQHRRMELDVQIEVLSQRLRQEGLR